MFWSVKVSQWVNYSFNHTTHHPYLPHRALHQTNNCPGIYCFISIYFSTRASGLSGWGWGTLWARHWTLWASLTIKRGGIAMACPLRLMFHQHHLHHCPGIHLTNIIHMTHYMPIIHSSIKQMIWHFWPSIYSPTVYLPQHRPVSKPSPALLIRFMCISANPAYIFFQQHHHTMSLLSIPPRVPFTSWTQYLLLHLHHSHRDTSTLFTSTIHIIDSVFILSPTPSSKWTYCLLLQEYRSHYGHSICSSMSMIRVMGQIYIHPLAPFSS